MICDAGKRETSNDTILRQKIDEDFDDDLNLEEDERDRRAIDEEDDEDFLQELDLLAREMERERENTWYG